MAFRGRFKSTFGLRLKRALGIELRQPSKGETDPCCKMLHDHEVDARPELEKAPGDSNGANQAVGCGINLLIWQILESNRGRLHLFCHNAPNGPCSLPGSAGGAASALRR